MWAVHLLGADGVVAGFFHAPTVTPTGVGVVLVPAFGWDDQSSYRPRRDWAEALAADGHAALRLDLPGSGDSAGGPDDAGLVDAWTRAVSEAARQLRDPGGCTHVVAIGIGLGGMLALAAVAADAPIDDVVLWGTPARGRNLTRELKAFGRLEASQTGEDLTQMPAGELRGGGHVMTAETVQAVSGLDAAALLATRAPARALVIGRDGSGLDAAVIEALTAVGTQVETDKGVGWADATAGPDASQPPLAVFAVVGAWLRAATTTTPPPTLPGLEDAAGSDLGGVRETPQSWEHAGVRLFGVLCEPVTGPVHGAALLLNAGAIRHIGPNRMWVELARRWARLGVVTLRMDVEGMGDSDGEPVGYRNTAGLHEEKLILHARSGLDQLQACGAPQPFLSVGMCSGAFWGFQVALRDARVRHLVALNQRALFWDPDAEPNRELRRLLRIATPTGFRNMLIGDQRLRRLGRLVRWLAATPVRWLRRSGPAAEDRIDGALRTLREQGQRLDFGFSDEEELYDKLVAEDRVGAFEAAGVAFHRLPLKSHTLKPVEAQVAAHALLDRVLADALPATAAEPAYADQ